MLKLLGNLIEKRPLLVISVVILITIGFGILIPSLEMKTDFKDFMPEDDAVDANWRIIKTFGKTQLMMFLYIEKENADSAISVDAVREVEYIEKELLELEEVASSLSIITIIDQICFLEFGKNIENCTDEELGTVINDILKDDFPREVQTFKSDDPNEEIDFNRFPRISRGLSIDEMDIKNCHISLNDESFTFTFQVYDLSAFNSKIRSPVPLANVVEWHLDFENIIQPDPMLDIEYKITAHIEPKHVIWEIGKGPLKNILSILNIIRKGELVDCYKQEAYLWVKQKNTPISFPFPLETAEINFNVQSNSIDVKVSRDELSKYGIVLRYGFFELPAKLTNFRAGTRYFQTPILRLPWLRVVTNTSFALETLDKLINRPIIGKIANNLLKNFGNFTYDQFKELFENTEQFISLPDQIALKDIEEYWETCDIAPDFGPSDNMLFIRTPLYDEMKVNILGILSSDYEKSQTPSATIMIININSTSDYDNQIQATEYIVDKIEKIDSKYDQVSVIVTGDTVITSQINEVTMDSNQIIMPVIFIMIIAVLFIFFRRTSYVLLPLLALVVSTIWIFGTMVLLNIPFTTMSVAIVPLILGLGVDYSVHLSHHYRLELSRGKTPGEAIKKSVFEVGTAMFLAMLTTVIAFLSFLSATVPPLRDFGILLALGIFYTFITALTLQASVRYIRDKRKKNIKIISKKKFKLNEFMGKLAQAILKNQKKILAALIITTIVAGYGATQIETGFDLYSFLPEGNEAMDVFGKLEEDFPYVGQDQEYIFLEGDVAKSRVLNGIRLTHENLEDDTFVTKKSDDSVNAESIYSIISLAVSNNETLIEEYNIDRDTYIPRTDKDVEDLFDYLLDSQEYGILSQLLIHKNEDGKYDATVIRIYTNVGSAGRGTGELEKDLELLDEELNQDLANYGDVKTTVTGVWIITHRITSSLTESQFYSTIISLFLATLVLIIVYRRITLGLIAIIPVLISIVWILGAMYFIGYNLDVLTITVTSLTIGIGIDYAIHATERFRLVADKTGDINAALCETVSKTGGALLIAALTTALGFGVLVIAPMPPQATFGVIMVLTITFSLLTSVLVLPLILARWAKWSKKKKGYIISSKPPDKDFMDDINNSE